MSPAGGSFTTTKTVTSATAGATLHYTADGSEPTSGDPTVSGAILVDETMTLKALTVKSGIADSVIWSLRPGTLTAL